jgi:translation initiation factor 2 subunit 3
MNRHDLIMTSTLATSTTSTSTSTSTLTLRLSEIIKGQAIFNCGTAGHVMHGKSTLVQKFTGTKTQRHKKEKVRNITINLGYANGKIFKNPDTGNVFMFPATAKEGMAKDPETGDCLDLLYHISFVDCPGHHLYMATMVSGSKIMDYALVIVAANESIPQPQTHQHILALDYSGITDMSFVLNKVDLVKEKDIEPIHQKLTGYLGNVGFKDPIIHPISAATGENVDLLVKFLASKVSSKIPRILEAFKKPLRMHIVRSYNVNKPNTKLEDLVGAVVGGTIESGVLSVGDQVELRPGAVTVKDGKRVLQPFVARVLSLQSDVNTLTNAIPGGLIGANLSIYAGLGNSDRLKGQVLGHVGTLPDIHDQLRAKFRIIDFRIKDTDILPVLQLNSTVNLLVNGIMNVKAQITELKTSKKDSTKGSLALKLSTPVVFNIAEKNSIAVMIKDQLVASLTVKEGSLSLPIVYPDGVDPDFSIQEVDIINDLEGYEAETDDFDTMVKRVNYAKVKAKKDLLPVLTVNSVNGARGNSYISKNELNELVEALTFPNSLKHPVDIKHLLVQNIDSELSGASPRFNEEGTLVMNGRIQTSQIKTFVTKFNHKMLRCPSCRNCQSSLGKEEKTTILRQCHSCPAVTYLHSTVMGKII